jgi:hypothetical protein
MRRKERLFERPLKRPVDDAVRQAIEAEIHRRRHEFPIPIELGWAQGQQSFTIASKWFNLLVDFAQDRMVVDAELTLAARVLATESNRQKLIAIINDSFDKLKL